MIILKNGRLFTMEGPSVERGCVVMDGGKIIAAGTEDILGSNPDAEVIDVDGGYIFPGFIDAHSHIGMWEDGMGFEGADGNEATDPVTPHLRAIDAINPLDRNFDEALDAGVTAAVTGPGSANVIGGQFAAIKTFGRRVDDMIIKAPVAIKAALGENPKTIYSEKHQAPMTRMATAALLREALFKTREYMQKLREQGKDKDKPDFDMKLEALVPVLEKRLPLKVHVHRADDIFTAIRIAKEFDIYITLDHCTEAHLIAEELSRERYPVLIGPTLCERSKIELKNLTFKTGGVLERAGIRPAIVTDHPVVPVQYLPVCAALAVREGMSETAALEGITINAARAAGIADRVGSIKPGKDADIAVFDQHPLNLMAKTRYVFVNGIKVKG